MNDRTPKLVKITLYLAFILAGVMIDRGYIELFSPPPNGLTVAQGGAILSVEAYTRNLQEYMIYARGITHVEVDGVVETVKADGIDGPITNKAFCMLMGTESMERGKND